MKFHPTEIERVVKKLIEEWSRSKTVLFKNTDSKTSAILIDIIAKELGQEEEINRLAEKMLEKYETQFQSGELDRKKLFALMKQQLIKDKKVIL